MNIQQVLAEFRKKAYDTKERAFFARRRSDDCLCRIAYYEDPSDDSASGLIFAQFCGGHFSWTHITLKPSAISFEKADKHGEIIVAKKLALHEKEQERYKRTDDNWMLGARKKISMPIDGWIENVAYTYTRGGDRVIDSSATWNITDETQRKLGLR